MLRALLVGALIFVPAAAASTIVVPLDQPTIQAAVDAAVDGDVIEIHGGDYAEAVVITSKNDLQLIGKGKVHLVAPILGTALTLTFCDGVTVEKIGFEGPGTGLAISNSGTITVTKCRFQNLDAGLLSASTDETTVEDCLFKTIRGAAVQVVGGPATLTHNRVQGAMFGFNLVGCAMTMSGNNVRKATHSGIRIEGPPTDADSVVEDNVIDGCRAFGILLDPGEITTGQLSIRHNLIKNVAQGAIDSPSGNFANAPSKILVEQNTIRNAGYQGIEFTFYVGQLSLLSNDLGKIRGKGFELSSLGVVDLALADNVVTSPGFDGVRSSIDAGTLSGNQIKSCGRFGVYLSGTGSTLTGNVLLGSVIFDLYQVGGANIVLPDNSIGSSGP